MKNKTLIKERKGREKMNSLIKLEISNENQVVVSSRQVAESFGKEHKNVLASINDILAAENSATTFFMQNTYENRGKQYPEYLMNRDGFSLLVMGFAGKEALQWKLKYIQAFNKMEEQLKSNFEQKLAIAKIIAQTDKAKLPYVLHVLGIKMPEVEEAKPKYDVNLIYRLVEESPMAFRQVDMIYIKSTEFHELMNINGIDSREALKLLRSTGSMKITKEGRKTRFTMQKRYQGERIRAIALYA